ncbi:hypothetical protein [Xanthobacter sp.]|uniref:hypothetical protein n=1 Tax=Xanthobacter sp. TaxID=35809 RepID=UPI0025FE577D|nr:hypothetical protein [Xanthobacter sp.]
MPLTAAFIRFGLLALGLAFILSGCGDDDLVVGHWLSGRMDRERPVSIEFAANGTFELIDANGSPARGQWRRTSDNALTLDFPDKASCKGKLSPGGKNGIEIISCTFESMTKRMQGEFYQKKDIEASAFRLACRVPTWVNPNPQVRTLAAKDVLCFDYKDGSCRFYLSGTARSASFSWFEKRKDGVHEQEISKGADNKDYEVRDSLCNSPPGSTMCILGRYTIDGHCTAVN